MSGRFAEREARRKAGAPPLDDVTKQVEDIDPVIERLQKRNASDARMLSELRASIAELRRDLAGERSVG